MLESSGAVGGACSSNCDGRLSHPFPTLAAFNAANLNGAGQPGDNDWIFVFESTTDYTGPATLRTGQKFIGQDATASLATLTGFPAPSGTDQLPVMNSGNGTVVNIAGTNVNGINLNSGNTLRGFTVGSVGNGTKISGTSFGTLIVGNNASPDVTLNGTGQALNLTTGVLSLTGGFVSVTSTSSAAQGISLAGVSDSGVGAFSFGSTNVSGSTSQGILIGTTTADLNFGNSTVSSTGSAISITMPAGATNTITFGNTSATTSGAGTTAVSWTGVANTTLTFNSLSIQRNNGTALDASGGGTVNVTNSTGSINNTTPAGPAIVAANIALNANFASINSTGGNNAVSLTSVTGTSNLGTGQLTGTAGGATFLVSGGTCSVTYSGNITQGAAAAMVSVAGAHSGTLTFQTGTLLETVGTGLQFNNADGTYNFSAGSPAGTTTLSGSGVGIFISNGSTGTFSFGANTSVTRANGIGGNAFDLQNSNANVTYSGSMTLGTGTASLVDIDNHDSGTITFDTGNLTKGSSTTIGIEISNSNGGTINFNNPTIGITMTTGDAVDASLNNDGGTMNFTPAGGGNGLDITTTSGRGFDAGATASDGGTLTITGSGNTIATTTGIALNVTNTTIGASGLTFEKISSNGAPSGIVLTTTGGNAGLTITGAGGGCTSAADCTGGAIQNSTTDGIQLTSTRSPSFTRLNVTDSAGGAGDDGILMTNVSGTVTIANCTFINSPHNGITVDNFNTSMDSFSFTNSTVSCASGQPCQPSGSIGNDGVLVEMRGTSVLPFGAITGSTFSGHRAVAVQVQATDSARIGVNSGAITVTSLNGTNSFVVQNNTFTGNGQGIDIDSSQISNVTFQALTNTIVGKVTAPGAISSDASAAAINAFTAAGADTGPTVHSFVGKIDGNIIGTQGVKDSGAGFGSGVRVVVQGVGTRGDVTVNANIIRETPNADIITAIGQNGAASSPAATARFKITGNNMPTPSGSNLGLCGPANTPCASNGIFVLADEGSPVCNVITGNTIYDVTTMNGSADIYLAERAGPPAGSALTVEGTGGSNSTYIQTNNTLSGASKFVDEGANTSQVAPGACGAFPLLLATGGVYSELGKLMVPTRCAVSDDSGFANRESANQLSTDSAWGNLTESAGSAALNTLSSVVSTSLTQEQLDAIVSAAQDRWLKAGLSAPQVAAMRDLSFQVSDLDASFLGEAAGNRILVDRTAQGKGWFIDATPAEDSEFGAVTSATRRYTSPMGAPAGRVDLLTAIEHEIGHKLGLDDSYAEKDRDSIMYGYVTVGERRLPAKGQATNARADSLTKTHFLKLDKPESTDQNSEVRKQTGGAERNHTAPTRALTPTLSGETVTANIGTLPAGGSVTITFQVTVNDPPSLTLLGPPRVENQGTVSGTNFANVLTDDPDFGGAADKTRTLINLFDTTTTLASDLNPSNDADLVTFTATVNETPVQGSADPSGLVDFIDTSNGNAVICNDVPISGPPGGPFTAQCAVSTLSAGSTHNIRADYLGDGNFDPSQSNLVAQVVNACVINPVVTNTNNSGAGSLRDALTTVCSSPNNNITFNIPAGDPGHVAGVYTITLLTELAIAKNVNITGPNSVTNTDPIVISGNNVTRVFKLNAGKTASITGLTISGGNSVAGGGVFVDHGTLTLTNVTVSGNTGGAGAGIHVDGSTSGSASLTVINSTITGNTTTVSGGGVYVNGIGGAATLVMTNSTVSGNNADLHGGGVAATTSTTSTLTNVTVTDNRADNDNSSTGGGGGIASFGTMTLNNTILAGNFNEDGATDAPDDANGSTFVAASASNLVGNGDGVTNISNGINNNQVGTTASPINPQLGPLANNGGTTKTHALLPTSPAVEAGNNAFVTAPPFLNTTPINDQRGVGFLRTADSSDINTTQTVDIGAFELHPSIEDIPNDSTNEDTVKNITFNLGDDTGSLIATVAATSSNTTVVPNANLIFSGSGGSRTLQITPASNQSGTTTITVTVTATNGRTAVDTFDLTVNALNDPPSGTDNTVSTGEDTAYTFAATDFGFTDPNDTPPNTLLAVKITTLPGLGTLTNNNVPVNAGDSIPVADINGGLLKFTPAQDGAGTPYTSFTFQVQDNGGGTDLDPTPNTMTINVTGVNDAPVNTVPAPQSTDEDVTLVFSGGNGNQISVADVDAGANPVKITLTATNGTITLSTTAGLSFILGDGTADPTMTFTGTLTAINTALNGMSFNPTANFSGAASLQIVSDDQGNTGSGGPLTDTDSVNITVNANNDAPAGADNTVTTAEDTVYTFTAADFGFTDPNDTPPNTLLAVKITTLPGLGTLTNNNVAVTAGSFIPVADINGGLLKFTPATDGTGTPYTTFTFQVQDNGGTLNSGVDVDPTPNTMTINVTSVNDAPVNTVPGPQSTAEDTSKVFSSGNGNQISVADADAASNPVKITLTATNGTATLSTTAGLSFTIGDGTDDPTMVFTGTLTAINTALNGMSFNPTPDFNGAASLQIVSDDQGNTGSGGALTDTDTINITVTQANDAPVVTATAGNLAYTENDPATAIDTGLTVTDVDSPNLVGATVAITSGFLSGQDTLAFIDQNGITGNYNSGSGVLTLTGSSSVSNYQTALRTVTYQNSSNDPTASRTVTFTADDGTSTTSATRGIAITAVNDAPVNTAPPSQGTPSNTPLIFSSGNGNQISVADADAGASSIKVTLTATFGTLTLNGTSGLDFTGTCSGAAGDGTADATMTFCGSLTNVNNALNGLTFTPTAAYSGPATLTITSNDQGNTGTGGAQSDTDVVNIQVATELRVNDGKAAEPTSGTTNLIFTVALNTPAPAGGVSVNFTTQDEPAGVGKAVAGTCGAGGDYTATSGSVSFAVGQQVKTINVPVCSDGVVEPDETFLVVLSSPTGATIADGTATGTITTANPAGTLLISEFRQFGPGPGNDPLDDFVEIYNNTDSPITVPAGGYGLFKMGTSCTETPQLIGTIGAGTVIPARGHFLFTGPVVNYSLKDYGGTNAATGNALLTADLGANENFGLFSTTDISQISSVNRFDAVGFGVNNQGACDLLRESTTLTPLTPVGTLGQHSFFRKQCDWIQGLGCTVAGVPKDTNTNADDFWLADTNASSSTQRLGAPGPENLASPIRRDSAPGNPGMNVFLLDGTVSSAANPNRERNGGDPAGTFGSMTLRHRVFNNTGSPVTRLRYRVVDISTAFQPVGPTADLRAISSAIQSVGPVNDAVTCTAAAAGSPPCTVTVTATTLETPPAQSIGGGYNSTLSSGTITTGTPLAPGASILVNFKLGVEKTGQFRFYIIVEALP